MNAYHYPRKKNPPQKIKKKQIPPQKTKDRGYAFNPGGRRVV